MNIANKTNSLQIPSPLFKKAIIFHKLFLSIVLLSTILQKLNVAKVIGATSGPLISTGSKMRILFTNSKQKRY